MIISKIIGGLGNQLFQYAVGKAASLHHNVPLKLDILNYETYKLHNGFRLGQFSAEFQIATETEVEQFKGKSDLIGKINRKLGLKKPYLKEVQNNTFQSSVFSSNQLYLDGFWQNEKYFKQISDNLVADFKVKKDFISINKKFRQEVCKNQSVGIHVRRGDFLKHLDIGVLSLQYYRRAVSYIQDRVEKPTFYLFSDDLNWCRTNLDFIDNAVFVDQTKSELDDFQLMQECKHNIIANSSFSWWAAWLNQNSDKIVVAPKRWMANQPPGCKWALDDWIEF